MPNKLQKWGLKAWVLADSLTGYVCNWKLYTGKESGANAECGLAGKVVLDLTAHLSGVGHHVYFDNFYTSPTLCKHLLELAVEQLVSTRREFLAICHRFI